MSTDKSGHIFIDVDNVRVTYVPGTDRRPDANWADADVLRIQAYKQPGGGALHIGAELPIRSPDAFIALIAALCTVYNEGRSGDTPILEEQE